MVLEKVGFELRSFAEGFCAVVALVMSLCLASVEGFEMVSEAGVTREQFLAANALFLDRFSGVLQFMLRKGRGTNDGLVTGTTSVRSMLGSMMNFEVNLRTEMFLANLAAKLGLWYISD